MNDWQLLQAWATERSDRAFAELVDRYLNLVYSSALRQVRQSDMAQDITQAASLSLRGRPTTLAEM